MTLDNSEVTLTKKDYLHLISRIEYLEQQVAKFNEHTFIHNDTNNSKLKKNNPPLLSHINYDDLCDNFDIDENEEDRETVQPLLRKNKRL